MTKNKKPFYKRIWFWVIVVILIFFFAAPGSGSSDSNQKTTEPTISESDFKAKCAEISYTDLARNPDAKKGEFFRFTGEVIQVVEYSKSVDIRINVTPVYWNDDKSNDPLYYQDTIFVTAKLGDDGTRILENDIITVYGICTGLYTYKSVLSSQVSIPGIKAEYWEIAG